MPDRQACAASVYVLRTGIWVECAATSTGSQYDPQVVEMFLQVLDADERVQAPALIEEQLHDAPSSSTRAALPDRETVAG